MLLSQIWFHHCHIVHFWYLSAVVPSYSHRGAQIAALWQHPALNPPHSPAAGPGRPGVCKRTYLGSVRPLASERPHRRACGAAASHIEPEPRSGTGPAEVMNVRCDYRSACLIISPWRDPCIPSRSQPQWDRCVAKGAVATIKVTRLKRWHPGTSWQDAALTHSEVTQDFGVFVCLVFFIQSTDPQRYIHKGMFHYVMITFQKGPTRCKIHQCFPVPLSCPWEKSVLHMHTLVHAALLGKHTVLKF